MRIGQVACSRDSPSPAALSAAHCLIFLGGLPRDWQPGWTLRASAVVTIAGHRTRHEEHRPEDFHRQPIRVIAELSEAAGAFLVRAAHDETRGWQWVSEPL
jgi:hypothetical protein